MSAARELEIDDWVVHRPNVVRSIMARVPGIDAEEAASRALEKMVRIVSTGGTIDDPAPYWRRAAVNEAISMTREAGKARPVEDDTLDGLTPPVEGAELDTERQEDVSMLRTALSDLADDDRKILLDRHVHDMAVADIAGDLGVRPHAVTMRLRRAEERLAGAFAAAHAQAVNEPECRITRAAMHDYLKDRLLPRRRNRVETHMDDCGECTRAFVDVREVSWMLRDYGQHLIAGGLLTGAAGATAAGGALTAQQRTFGKKEAAVAAGVLAVLAVGGTAAALVANQAGDDVPVQAVQDSAPGDGSGGGSGGGGGAGDGGGGAGSGADAGDDADGGSDDAGAAEQPVQDPPASIPPADPAPRPATTPKEDGPQTSAPETAPAAEPPADPAPGSDDAPPSSADPAPDPDQGSGPGEDGSDPPPQDESPAPPDAPAPGEPEPPVDEPEPPEAPQAPGTALELLLANLGLDSLPGIDLATSTLNDIWELLFGAATDAADEVTPDAED